MAVSGADIVNQALELIDSQTFVTGVYPNFTDGTPQNVVGSAANKVYAIARDLLLQVTEPEFARLIVAAQPAALGALQPILPWQYEYLYPDDGIRVRRIRPPKSGAGALADPNDPLPVRGLIAYDNRVGIKAILTNQQNAFIVYTSNSIPEAVWDSVFVEAMSRRLANPLAMAIAGRPDFAKELLAESQQFASLSIENAEL